MASIKKLFNNLKGIYRVFAAAKNLFNSIKSAISLIKMPLAGWALILVAAVAIYGIVRNYEALKNAVKALESSVPSAGAPAPKGAPVVKIDKSAPDWKKKYCHEEVAKLPPAPFAYDKIIPPFYQLPSPFIKPLIPEDKRDVNAYACGLEYKYDNEPEAFESLGVKYDFNIHRFIEFSERIYNVYKAAMLQEWRQLFLLEKDSPYRGHGGLPLIYTRESERADTVEYAEISRLPNSLYIKFTFYEK